MRTNRTASPSRRPAGKLLHLAVVVLGAAGLAACGEASSKPEPSAPVVRVQTVTFALDATERRYTGVIAARHEADQAFQVAGKIIERLVDVGDRVAAGQPIARLDPVDLDLLVDSAEAEVAAATAAVEQATADEERGRQLAARNVTTDADHDRRRLALEEAKGRLVRAERQLALARNQRTYATLTASSAGVVTAVSAEAGQVVAVGQPVARIADGAEVEIEVAIPEGSVADIDDATATVTLWSDGSQAFAAKLRELAPEADAATRTYLARFSLAGAGSAAKLGMTGTLVLKEGAERPTARLPLSAILDQGTGPTVFVVNASGTLSLQPVAVVRYGATEAVIGGGVADGDRVVTLGVNRLRTGQHVRVAAAD